MRDRNLSQELMDERMLNHIAGDLLEANGFCFRDTQHLEPFVMGTHAHQEAHFSLLISGRVESSCQGRSSLVGASTFSYTPPEVEHKTTYLDKANAFYIAVRKSQLDKLQTMLAMSFVEPFDLTTGPILDLGSRLYCEYRTPDASTPLVMEGLMLDLYSRLFRSKKTSEVRKPPTWLNLARDIIHAEYATSLSIEQMANRVGVHPVHLMRAFRFFYGTTLGAYARNLRLEESRRRLALEQNNVTIGEIAIDLGFSDQQHFSHTFRKHFGVTPSEYRKSVSI